MAYIVRIPKLGVTVEEASILKWFVDEADAVEANEVILEIENEKTTAEVEAREDGVLRRKYKHEGDTGTPGTPIGIVAGLGENISEFEEEVAAYDE